MKEAEIFENVIRWGIAQTTLSKELKQWQDEHFQTLQNTLQECLPLIRFYHISSVDFYHEVKPFSRILPANLYEDLLHHYLVRGSHDNDVTAQGIRRKIDSKLLNHHNLLQIDSWIKATPNFSGFPGYKLILRGSRDGFTPSDFHRLCDDKGPTVTLIRVRNTGQLIGGYTLFSWSSNKNGEWKNSDDNFIFSLGKEMGDQVIQSKQKSGDTNGVYSESGSGPLFGQDFGQPLFYNFGASTPARVQWNDLRLHGANFQTNSECCSRQNSYQLPILNGAKNGTVNFSVEEYEVFQVVNKSTQFVNSPF